MTRATLFPIRRAKRGTSTTSAIEEQIQHAGLPEPDTEFQFALSLGRRWKFDLAWPELHIAFEQEGATFAGRMVVVQVGFERRKGRQIPLKPGTVLRLGGRHNQGAGFDKDCEKYNHAAALGWRVIRASTRMIRDGEAIAQLRMAFERLTPTQQINPPSPARTASPA